MGGYLWSLPSTTNIGADQKLGSPPTSRWRRVIDSANKWLGITEENGEWLKDMRGNLSMVATIIATMTFQIGLNPPGGVVQNFNNGVVDCTEEAFNGSYAYACPGESVYAAAYEHEYNLFMSFNNISFFSSLIVCLCLVSGVPLNHRLPTWLLAIGMCVSLTSLAMTYVYGLYMVTPFAPHTTSYRFSKRSVRTWFAALVGFVGFILVVRFVLSLLEIFTKRSSNASINVSATREDSREWIITCENSI